jgi:hypothetical protein
MIGALAQTLALNLKIYPYRRGGLHYRYVNLAFQASD